MYRILILVLFIVSTAQAGSPLGSLYSGDWRGVGIQSGGADWSMQVFLGPSMGEVRYPSLRCGGIWQYSAVTAQSLSGVETINYGLENCIETGSIYLQPDGKNRMIFMWCGEEDGVSALAILVRNQVSEMAYSSLRAASQAALDTLGTDLKNITCRGNTWFGV